MCARFAFPSLAACLVIGSAALGQDPAPTPGQELLTRGPIHESFAQPVVYDPKPGPVIPKPPPAPIREVPPDQRPEGNTVDWIPGYWAWDDGRGDYLWVSGVWRAIPPGRQWVPGYWHEVAGGVQWAPGTWLAAGAESSNYLPVPPNTLETGPNSPAPTPDSSWAPGCWVYGDAGYAWRPGFWVAPQPNWVWVPAQYVWTPGGYLFADGYWDRPFDRRGQMFAPVYFSQPIYAQPAYVYQPTIGIVATGLIGGLFVRPSIGVYYFGDFYAQSYFSLGIYPSYAYHTSRFGYDPIYSYYSVTYARSNPGWGASVRESYIYRRDHVEARPVHTYAEMSRVTNTTIINNHTTIINNNVRNVSFASPISTIAAEHNASGTGQRFTRVTQAEQTRHVAQAERLQTFGQQRAGNERVVAAEHRAAGGPGPRSVAMARSPIAAPHPAAHSLDSATTAHRDEMGSTAGAPRNRAESVPGHPSVSHAGLPPQPHASAEHYPPPVPPPHPQASAAASRSAKPAREEHHRK